MSESTTSFDECTLEQLASDERADSLRNEAEQYERALFLSEATAAAEFERQVRAGLLIVCEAVIQHNVA